MAHVTPSEAPPPAAADPAPATVLADHRGAAEPEPLLVRVLALLTILVVLDLWMVHHVGHGVRNVSAFVLLAGVIGGMAKILDRVFPDELKALGARAGEILRAAARPPVLGVAALFVLLVLVTVSSVVVVTEEGTADPNVRIVPLDDPDAARSPALDEETRLVRAAFLPTTPFGRTVRVEADGYVSGLFDVYPITGLRLRLGTDLRPSPSVLIRPGVDALGALLDHATIRVWRLTDTGRDLVASDSGRAAAFMLGRPRTIAAGQREDWQRELTRQGAPESVAADIIGTWHEPVLLTPQSPLQPGTRLLVEVGYSPEAPVTSAEVTLGDESLVDVPLFAPFP